MRTGMGSDDCGIARHVNDETDKQGSDGGVQDGGPELGLDRCDADERDEQAKKDGHDKNDVELTGAGEGDIDTSAPTEQFRQRICSRTGQYRYSKKARSDDANSEQDY